MEPMQKLYLNVIIQAIEDLTSAKPAGTRWKAEVRKVKREAKAWFRSNSEDFKEVCDNAGINSRKLRKTVLMSKPSHLQGLLDEFRTSI